jgi:hypothetical protein
MENALNHIKASTISVDEWATRVKRGHKGRPYKYKDTEIYKALRELERSKYSPKPAPPQPEYHVIDLKPVQRCLFLTGDTSRALETRDRLLIATADLGYRQYYSQEFIHNAIAQDRFRVWCDCRAAPDGTPPDIALIWLRSLGLPSSYFYGQGETANEYQRGYDAGARKFVVNMSTLLGPLDNPDTQLGKVETGECIVTNETYFNVNRDYPVNWRNADGVGSNCMAVYASVREGATYYSLSDQARDGKYNPQADCVYVASFTNEDWQFVIDH